VPRQAGSDRSHAFPGPQRAVVAVNGAVATDRGGGKMGRDDDRESSSVLRYGRRSRLSAPRFPVTGPGPASGGVRWRRSAGSSGEPGGRATDDRRSWFTGDAHPVGTAVYW